MRRKFFIVSIFLYTLPLSIIFVQTLSAQDQVFVRFFDTGKKDTTAFFGGSKSSVTAIHSAVNMDGNVIFVDSANSTAAEFTRPTTPCTHAITDGKEGANVLFLGNSWTNEKNGNITGIGYVTFMGTQKQEIKNATDNPNTATFPGIQLNNEKDVHLQGNKGIKVDKKANFFKGKLHVTKDTLTLGKNLIPTCDDKSSYIELTAGSTNGIVAKDTGTTSSDARFSFNFPIGSDKSYSPITVVMDKATGGSGSTNDKVLVRFDNKVPITETVKYPNQKRYDKGANSFWTVKTTMSNPKIDSVYLAVEKDFAKKEISDNFRRSRALITQYIKEDKKSTRTLTSGSNWDRPTMTEAKLRPEVITKSKPGTKTTLFQYKRGGKSADSLTVVGSNGTTTGDYSFYTLANYDDHTLITRFDSSNFFYDNKACIIKTPWIFKDKFSGQEYYMELTTDTANGANTKTHILKIYDNLASFNSTNEVYDYNVPLRDIPPNIFTNNEPIYARLLEQDLGGKTYSLASQPFFLECSGHQSDESVPLVSATSSAGGTQMIVQYDATYSEEIELTVWNILGQKELELGHRNLHAGRNNLVFNLPVSISRNQRYVLLISGGVLNEKIKMYSLTFVVK